MADRICDNCMSRVPEGAERCPKCGIQFENTNPGGALPNGWVLGERYTVGRYIDIDGEGVTYSAIDGNTLQRVIIKEFMPVTLCASRDETGAIRAKPGCEVLFKTTRMDFSDLFGSMLRMGLVEGLVQVLDVLEANNTAYAVLEKIEGPTLAEYLTKREGPVESARALALMRPVMAGVEAMHTANLVHRGISPENIILESGGTAKLTGFATLALRQQGSELKPKLYPGYSAPEQYAASEFEGRYTDIYALGAVLYRLVTGSVPASADERKLQDTLRPARTLNKEVPTFLSSGIARAMRLLPAERIQTVPDLRLALTGEGAREAKGPLGLTRQQLIVGASALGAIVLLLLVILFIWLFAGKGGDDDSSSSSAPSSVSVGEGLPSFVDKRYEDVGENSFYTSQYLFEKVEEYSLDVEEGRIISQTPKAGEIWDGVTPIKLVVSLGAEPFEMPNFVNPPVTQKQAMETLKNYNILDVQIKIEIVTNTGEYEEGDVVKTLPEAGTAVKPNLKSQATLVTLHVAGPVQLEGMPDLVGKTQAEAESIMNGMGVAFEIQTVANDGTKKAGTVASTAPNAGEQIAVGATKVIIYVYDKYYMPNLNEYLGKAPTELQAFLDARNIAYRFEEVDNTDPAKNGLIHSLNYTINAEVTSSTVVVIYVYKTVTPPSSS